jgi:hypothetical protein
MVGRFRLLKAVDRKSESEGMAIQLVIVKPDRSEA